MLISHETPISFLEESRKYNDYDYALVHLFETHPEYYAFFKSSVKQGREVLLDNSIFELKEAFNSTKYAEYIKELLPTYFIVPDVLENSEATIESFTRFNKLFPKLPGLKIGAVQGKTYQELVDCYRFMSDNADYIAISFDYSWYQTIGVSYQTDTNLAKLERMANGRPKFIRTLMYDGVWNYNKPHHLLGCSLAREFNQYKNIDNIRSCDTSNPVVGGIFYHEYLHGIGMNFKPSIMLADLIDTKLNQDQKDNILRNVSKFRKICNS
jgi:hypothetical protein